MPPKLMVKSSRSRPPAASGGQTQGDNGNHRGLLNCNALFDRGAFLWAREEGEKFEGYHSISYHIMSYHSY